jgi:ferredoxin
MVMKIVLDIERCQGHGRCYDLARELFDVDDERATPCCARLRVMSQRPMNGRRPVPPGAAPNGR